MQADEDRFSLRSRGAFAAFYRAHADRLLSYVVRRVLEHEVALDLTAEAFAVAFLKRSRFRGKTQAEAEAWLYKIATTQIIRYRRRGVAEQKATRRLGLSIPQLDDADIERIHDLAGTDELRQIVAEELAHLSSDQRQALSLRVIDELPYPEVADRLGVTEQVARARVSRGLARLARAIEATA
jgi:RNA polymerase sigma factor (sigma-70 family)